MQGQVVERLRAPMCVPPSNSFLLVLGCFLVALLHLFSQSAHLSTPPAFSQPTLHDPILHYDAVLQQLATETQIHSLPLDSISIMNNLQMFDSEHNVPSSTQDLISTPTQFRALDVAIGKSLPYEGFEASIMEEVKASKLPDISTNYNADSEKINIQPPHAANITTIAPNSEGRLTACERSMHMNQNGDSENASKCESETDDDQANVIDDQKFKIDSLDPNERPIINAEQNNNFLRRFVTMLGQASSQNLSQNVMVQKEIKVQGKEGLQQKGKEPTTKITQLKEEDDESVIEPQQSEAIKLNDVIKEPIDPHEHASPQPSINSTAKERLDWLKNNWDRIKILYTDDHAKEFSTRIDNFLTASNTGAGACELRFFMIWIAPLSAFGPREKLALESVFASHPSACLVILSRTLDTPQGRLILDPLSDRGFKVLAITPHIPFLLQSTPAEKWFKDLRKGLIDPGIISINQNLSNLIRLVVLYKYGGVYVDNDVIVMKSFANFSNVIGAQNIDRETGKWNRLNNAVMIFEKESPLLLRFIEEFSHTFNGSKWGHNGPYLVSRVAMKEGNWGCKVMDPLAFYPVDWDHIGGFFQAPRNSVEKQWVVAKMAQLIRHSFSIHLWNKLSRDMEVEPGSIMDSIFRRFCILCDLRTNNTVIKVDA